MDHKLRFKKREQLGPHHHRSELVVALQTATQESSSYDVSAVTSGGLIFRRAIASPSAASRLVLADVPLLNDGDDAQRLSSGLYWAMGGRGQPAWPGGSLYESADGAAWLLLEEAFQEMAGGCRSRRWAISTRRADLGGIRARARLQLSFRDPHPGRARGRGVSRRILVVEDQEDSRTILRDLLHSVGYEVLEALDGAEGVRMAQAERPDLILMDIQMPGVDGYEAARSIKSEPGLAAIPIIAVTSYALSGDQEKACAAGCDDYVTKPFSPRALLAKVVEWLDRTG